MWPDRDAYDEEGLCRPFWYYLFLRDLGLITYPTRYGIESLLRCDRARAALKNRKRRACHHGPVSPTLPAETACRKAHVAAVSHE